MARLMQITAHAQAGQAGLAAQAGQGHPPGAAAAAAAAAGIPPGLLAGHPGAAAAAAAGIPVSSAALSLLAGLPNSATTPGGSPNLPHPAFASLLAQQKPGSVPPPGAATLADALKSKEDDLKRPAENGGKKINWK